MSKASQNVLRGIRQDPAAVALAKEVEALEERITTMCDEECGLQPVQSADDSLTMIEHGLREWRHKHRELDAQLAEAERKLAAVRAHLRTVLAGDQTHPRFSRDDGNAPGHAHSRPGIWDWDNGERANKPCQWCADWHAAHAILDGKGE